MTDGIFVRDYSENGQPAGWRRPKSKKEVRERVADDPSQVQVESTSLFGGFGGPADLLQQGTTVTFVGPDPRGDRRFYGTLTRTAAGKLVIK